MRTALVLAAALAAGSAAAQGPGRPVLDLHLHARAAGYIGPDPPPMCAPFAVMPRWENDRAFADGFVFGETPCDAPVPAAPTDVAVLAGTLEQMARYNIVGVLTGEPDMTAAWRAAAPDRFIRVGLDLRVGVDVAQPHVAPRTPDDVRRLHAAGAFDVLGEVMAQYEGMAPDDPRLAPYWALAEELDLPVAIHLGPGGPGESYSGSPVYRARLGNPLGMEEVLVRHPRLRVYLMHAGYPFAAEARALLFAHPQVYLEVGSIVYTEPRAAFYRFLQEIVEAGYGDRVLFGSDQMIWPGIIGPSVEAIVAAPFLSEAQKRAILYDNAARFLRLSDDEITRHHAR